jgi:heptosyltransferase-2
MRCFARPHLPYFAGGALSATQFSLMDASSERGQDSIGDAGSPIVVFGFPGLGDMVRCHSLVRIISAQNRGRPIDIVGRRPTVEIAEFMPEIREAIGTDFQHRRLNPVARLALSNMLRKRHYGTAYIAQSSFKAALIPFIAQIPERIGWAEECRLPLLTRPRFGMRRLSRMVDRTCHIGFHEEHDMPASWPEPRLRVPSSLRGEFEALAEKARTMAPVVAIAPGSSDRNKNWPVENYVAITRYCIEAGCTVWIVGGSEHRNLAAAIMQSAPARDYLTTSLKRLALTIAAADIFIGNDSGPLHVAAAFNKPSVGVFGMTEAPLNAPINAVVKVAIPEFAIARKSKTEIHWPSLEPVVRRLDRAIDSVRRPHQAV